MAIDLSSIAPGNAMQIKVGNSYSAQKNETEENGIRLSMNGQKPQGDKITISSEAMKLAQSSKEENDPQSQIDQMIERIKKKIEQVKKEIKELENSNLPEEEKKKLVQQKQQEMLQLTEQLQKALDEKNKGAGNSSGGGTRAEGFANSLT